MLNKKESLSKKVQSPHDRGFSASGSPNTTAPQLTHNTTTDSCYCG